MYVLIIIKIYFMALAIKDCNSENGKRRRCQNKSKTKSKATTNTIASTAATTQRPSEKKSNKN